LTGVGVKINFAGFVSIASKAATEGAYG
jgi:hypothetical protein